MATRLVVLELVRVFRLAFVCLFGHDENPRDGQKDVGRRRQNGGISSPTVSIFSLFVNVVTEDSVCKCGYRHRGHCM